MAPMPAPTSLRAGDSAAWTESLPDYPASDGWTLKYRILWRAGAPVDFSASASGDDYAVSLAAADSAAWTPGPATLVRWLEQGADRVTIGRQPIEILPDLTVATEFDGRTTSERGLDDARAALAAYTASGRGHVEEYEVAGRRLRFRAVQDIKDLITHYEAEVAKERALRAAVAGVAAGRVCIRN